MPWVRKATKDSEERDAAKLKVALDERYRRIHGRIDSFERKVTGHFRNKEELPQVSDKSPQDDIGTESEAYPRATKKEKRQIEEGRRASIRDEATQRDRERQ